MENDASFPFKVVGINFDQIFYFFLFYFILAKCLMSWLKKTR